MEDKDAVGDGCCAGALGLVVGPVALHEPPVHVLPVHLHRAVELHRNRKTSVQEGPQSCCSSHTHYPVQTMDDSLRCSHSDEYAAEAPVLQLCGSLDNSLASLMIRDPADSATSLCDSHRELLCLRGLPVVRAKQPEVGGLHELVDVLQERHLLLIQIFRG